MTVGAGGRYLRATGLRALAQELRGDEVVHAGMRPYGFHAGNKAPILCYPILLGEEMLRRGVEPRFRYLVTLNDWETDGLAHPAGYPLNVTPSGRSFQHQPDPDGCSPGLVDHWESHLRRELAPIQERFPAVQLSLVRASQIRDADGMQRALEAGLARPQEVRLLLEETLKVVILDAPLQFLGAVCPSCRSIQGETSYAGGRGAVTFRCAACGSASARPKEALDYWLYVHLLGAAKYLVFRPDVWIFGGDFLEYRTVDFLDRMVEALDGKPPAMKHLITPILLGPDGEKMSKSRGNLADLPLERLLSLLRGVDESAVPFPQLSA
ncbi:MAG: hypothetical protein HYY02_10395 [Chloroflexi bacterium]|nr:hypothetical protein [Chloroflexota bacterium]